MCHDGSIWNETKEFPTGTFKNVQSSSGFNRITSYNTAISGVKVDTTLKYRDFAYQNTEGYSYADKPCRHLEKR